MECVNAAANQSRKRDQSLPEEIDEAITQASNTNEPLAYDKNNSNSKLVEAYSIHGCSKEEYISIHELLQHIADSEFVLNLIMTITYLSSGKIKQVKSILLGALDIGLPTLHKS